MIAVGNVRRLAITGTVLLLLSLSSLTTIAANAAHASSSSKVHCAKKYHHQIGRRCFNYHYDTKKGCYKDKATFVMSDDVAFGYYADMAQVTTTLHYCVDSKERIVSSSLKPSFAHRNHTNDYGFKVHIDKPVRSGSKQDTTWTVKGYIDSCFNYVLGQACSYKDEFQLTAEVKIVDTLFTHHVVYLDDVSYLNGQDIGQHHSMHIRKEDS